MAKRSHEDGGRGRGSGTSPDREEHDPRDPARSKAGREYRGASGAYGAGTRFSRAGGGMSSPAEGGSYRGCGPRGYRRSDERILEDVNDRLTWDGDIDAREIEVRVENGEVTLSGIVDDRRAKRLAEDIAEDISGVTDVHNRLTVRPDPANSSSRSRSQRHHRCAPTFR